jgi:hypothetical protein
MRINVHRARTGRMNKRKLQMPGGVAVITLEDCIALCGLSEEEVLAIAEHEHIPEIAAAALGDYLLHQAHGAERIRDMLRDDIRVALGRDDRTHARALFMALRRFLSTHPEATEGMGARQR